MSLAKSKTRRQRRSLSTGRHDVGSPVSRKSGESEPQSYVRANPSGRTTAINGEASPVIPLLSRTASVPSNRTAMLSGCTPEAPSKVSNSNWRTVTYVESKLSSAKTDISLSTPPVVHTVVHSRHIPGRTQHRVSHAHFTGECNRSKLCTIRILQLYEIPVLLQAIGPPNRPEKSASPGGIHPQSSEVSLSFPRNSGRSRYAISVQHPTPGENRSSPKLSVYNSPYSPEQQRGHLSTINLWGQ